MVNSEEREKELGEVKVEAEAKAEAAKKEKGKKKEKGDSQKFSFELFRQGMSVEEISKTRNLVVSTVEGHLSQYVANGELRLEELLPGHKIQAIRQTIVELNSDSAKLIREKLGEEYSYGEIRLVLAAYALEK